MCCCTPCWIGPCHPNRPADSGSPFLVGADHGSDAVPDAEGGDGGSGNHGRPDSAFLEGEAGELEIGHGEIAKIGQRKGRRRSPRPPKLSAIPLWDGR